MLKKQFSKFEFEAGTDEAGRGCLAGPVVAAAVILPQNFNHTLLNDSKKLSEKTRKLLRPIIETEAISFSVSFVSEKTIDEINILNASILAMHQALKGLEIVPEFIAVDGNRFKSYQLIPYQTLVKGDGNYLNIAAASVLAKTYRDEFMEKIHCEFPQFQWKNNKGYATQDHRDAIAEFGLCDYHRKSFKLKPKQFKLDL